MYNDQNDDIYKKQLAELRDEELEFIKAYVPNFDDYNMALELANILDVSAAEILLRSLAEGDLI